MRKKDHRQFPRWQWYREVKVDWKEMAWGIGVYSFNAQLLWFGLGPIRLIVGRLLVEGG